MTETTPLLDDIEENTPRLNTNVSNDDSEAFDNFKRLVDILKNFALILSSLSLALIIADYIIIMVAPFGGEYYTWNTLDACKELGAIVCVAILPLVSSPSQRVFIPSR
jgi:hypothetical protein